MSLTASQAGALGGYGKLRGDRVSLAVRIPRDLKAAIDAGAAESQLPMGDYVTLLLARRLGVPDPEYIAPADLESTDELDLGLPDRRERRLTA